MLDEAIKLFEDVKTTAIFDICAQMWAGPYNTPINCQNRHGAGRGCGCGGRGGRAEAESETSQTNAMLMT